MTSAHPFIKPLPRSPKRGVALALLSVSTAVLCVGTLEAAEPPAPRVPTSWVDTKKALSAVTLHRGLVLAPLGADGGGGKGAGALAVYDVRDPAKPLSIFDSRDYKERYHVPGGRDYLGDSSEYHHAILSGDRAFMADRRPNSAGFFILELAPLYDRDPATLPAVICRFTFPNVNQSTNYDGYSFALDWAGGRYVYAPTGSHGLFVIDTLDLAQPKVIAHLTNAQLGNQVLRAAVALGDLLIVSPVSVNVNGGRVMILDISDPARPTVVNSIGNVSMGYQGFLYGSRFFNVATFSDGKTPSRIQAWDLKDPLNITEQTLATVTGLKHPEYGFGKDGDLFLGHYHGSTRWSLATGQAVQVDRVEPQEPPGDDYAFLSPVGPLIAVTSDHNVRSRLNFAPLDRPDQVPPSLLYSRPMMGATNVARTTGIGLAFSDFLDTARLGPTSFRLQKAGSAKAIPVTVSHFSGLVNLVPVAPLDPNSTYELLLDPEAVRDGVGNRYAGAPGLLRFSTGRAITPYNVMLTSDQPRVQGEEATLAVRELAAKGIALEHAWDFGDGTPPTPFAPAGPVRHRFTAPGRQVVKVSTRRVGDTKVTQSTVVQVIHRPLAERRPLSSGTIALDAAGATVFAVNPDHGTVAALNAVSLERRWEVAVGKEPAALTVAADGRVWVTVREPAQVVVLDAGNGALLRTIALPPGAAPQGVLVVGDRAYVACSGTDSLQEIDAATGALTRRVAVADPRHLAWDSGRDRLVVPRFLSRGSADGTVTLIDRASLAPLTTIALGASPGPDSGTDGRGTPNYLAAPVLTPDLGSAWIPGKKDNLERGPRRDGQPLTFDHTVRSVGVRLDLDRQVEAFADREDFDNSDFTTAVVASAAGDLLFFASHGSNSIWVMESEGDHKRFSLHAGGEGPIGLAMAPDGRTLYVHHLISRSVAALDIAGLVAGNGVVGAWRSGSTAANEVLAPDVLAGKRLFHDSTNSALSQEGYMSCASCHFDGGHDGRTWDLSQFGEGLRNTLDLRGKAGMGQGPLHWSGNFDEVQDFEGQIRGLNQGDGLLPAALLNAHGKAVEPADGEPKAGLSKDLDQLAAYVASLDRTPTNPARPAAGLSPAARRGREQFIALDCMSCHVGAAYTDSAPGVRHDVGTLSAASGERLGRPLDGLDTPTLLGLDRSAPYLHDGSAATLEDVLTTRNFKGLHGATAKLSASEREDLVAFLRELSAEDAPTLAEVSPGQSAPQFGGLEPILALPSKAAADLVLGTVSATDADRGQKISYRLKPGGDAGFFRIDAETGVLRWVGTVPCRQAEYAVVVVAVDDGRVPAAAERKVTVRLDGPAPKIQRTGTDKEAQFRVSWLAIGSFEKYTLEAGPAKGPFHKVISKAAGYGAAGSTLEHAFPVQSVKGATLVRLVGEETNGKETRSRTLAELPLP